MSFVDGSTAEFCGGCNSVLGSGDPWGVCSRCFGLSVEDENVQSINPKPLNVLSTEIYENAKAKGFWDEERNFGEMIALAHSELSEALDEHRKGKPNFYLQGGKPEGIATELADCLIRILDTMHSLDVDIDEVVRMKMFYNSTRPFKHNRAY